MGTVGVRELKSRASEILREVRERRARYTITYRGRAVGVLLPIGEAPETGRDADAAWEELIRLGKRIGEGWQSELSSAELLSSMRR